MTFSVEGLTLGVEGLTLSVEGLTLSVEGLTLSVEGLTLSVQGLTLSVEGLTLSVEGLTSALVREIGDVFFSLWVVGAPQNFSLVLVKFQPVRCHPCVNVIDTQSQILT